LAFHLHQLLSQPATFIASRWSSSFQRSLRLCTVFSNRVNFRRLFLHPIQPAPKGPSDPNTRGIQQRSPRVYDRFGLAQDARERILDRRHNGLFSAPHI